MAKDTIKAIETRYAGYKFRSRLEARYAVFFDALNVPYEYEKEGYDLPSGWYLPDFWLPELNSWLEVKGQVPSNHEFHLCAELANGTNRTSIIAVGMPGEPLLVFCCESNDGGGSLDWWGIDDELVRWAIPTVDLSQRIVLDSGNDRESRAFMSPGWDLYCPMTLSSECNSASPILAAAFDAARSARFEHGERP